MQTLRQLLRQPLRAVPNSVVIFLLIVALIGFADAGYLTVEHYSNLTPPCAIGGCETVLTSAYSSIAGIPVSLLGAIYYLFILVGIVAYLEGKHEKLLRLALLVVILGFIAELWFVYLQAFVIHVYCLYCMGSAITTTILFVAAISVFKRYSSHDQILNNTNN